MAERDNVSSRKDVMGRPMTASQWREILRSQPERVRAALGDVYGDLPGVIEARMDRLAGMIEMFAAQFGLDRPVVVARAPGRINLMGRHIDHRGGCCNPIAIHNDVWIVAAASRTPRLRLRNLDAAFSERDLDAADLRRVCATQSWSEFIDCPEVCDYLTAHRGDWANYGLGAWLRFSHECDDRLPPGLDAVYWGDVPRSVGLSSSSSVFVATAIALARHAGLAIAPDRLATFCGEGEWFVGTRGGAGDHAAMLFGRRGQVSQIGFFPMRLEGQASLPSDVEIILCNSGERAQKSRDARDRFNGRVAAYEIALAILRRREPGLTAQVEHLRDLHPERLGVGVDGLYEALKAVPVWMTREEIAAALPGELDRIENWFASHGDLDGGYPLRAVLLYGVAECERSRQALAAMSGGDARRIRQLFKTSHDGDRVTVASDPGERIAWRANVDDEYLDGLIRLARSDDPGRRECAALAWQPGAYGCSTPGIDEMVDLAMATDGVLGAQLVGAGLGGSIVVLARSGTVDTLRRGLEESYYGPRRIEPEVHVFQPAAGAACFDPAT